MALAGQRVLLRLDLNVPMADGAIGDTTRIDRALPTLRDLIAADAKIIILSHFGRPRGMVEPALSLKPVAGALQAALEGALAGRKIRFCDQSIGEKAAQAVAQLQNGDVIVLENLRFHPGEETNDPTFTAALAALGDVYINDAFSCAHRAHASTEGLAHLLPALAGRAMKAEIKALSEALSAPERPMIAVVGGAKISSKLAVLNHLVAKVDGLIIGGAMANTFLAAQGVKVGKSLCEHDMLDVARGIMAAAERQNCRIHLPSDVVLADTLAPGVASAIVAVDAVPADKMILDIGPATAAALSAELATCRTLVWNGPMGAFEVPPFDAGTNALAQSAAALARQGKLFALAGGGDTVAALNHAGVAADFNYISTAGGAFLEWLEGKTLPGIAALQA